MNLFRKFKLLKAAIRTDIDRISKLFEGFEKTTEKFKANILAREKEAKVYKLSNENTKEAWKQEKIKFDNDMSRKTCEFEEEKRRLNEQIETLSSHKQELDHRLSTLSTELVREKSVVEIESKKLSESNQKRSEIEATLVKLQSKFDELKNQLKEAKNSNSKMKKKIIELSEVEAQSIKSTEEKSVLSLRLESSENLISKLREDIWKERKNNQCNLSAIEQFRQQVKNGT